MTSNGSHDPRSGFSRRGLFKGLGLAASVLAAGTAGAEGAGQPPEAKEPAADPSARERLKELTPAEKMARRFPQPVKVSYLIGLPMIDERNETLGHVRHVARDGAGRIRLVIDYGGWFGYLSRLVAVPVEVCAMLGRQVAAADMPRAAFEPAPTWYGSGDVTVGTDEIILVAVMRR